MQNEGIFLLTLELPKPTPHYVPYNQKESTRTASS